MTDIAEPIELSINENEIIEDKTRIDYLHAANIRHIAFIIYLKFLYCKFIDSLFITLFSCLRWSCL